MSRLAKKPIIVPQGVSVTLNESGFIVKGPLGEVSLAVRPEISIVQGAEGLEVSTKKSSKLAKALVGTYSSHLKAMIKGVGEKYMKKLILEGVGYKSEVKPASTQGGGTNLNLALGFSHPVIVAIPTTLTVTAEKNVISVSGIDKALVGEFTAKIRELKKPEPYKGKGFRYEDEIIRRKQGKKTV